MGCGSVKNFRVEEIQRALLLNGFRTFLLDYLGLDCLARSSRPITKRICVFLGQTFLSLLSSSRGMKSKGTRAVERAKANKRGTVKPRDL